MTFAVFIPVFNYAASAAGSFPVVFYLSGLTCTDENACHKLGAFTSLAENQLAMVFPDTSPRGCNVPGEADSWDFGVGAGFYIDATMEPWSTNWRMETYIATELPSFLRQHLTCLDFSRCGISGHSMGGHGALTLALKHPSVFRSVSAFAPISNPPKCPWGVKAFTNYLGPAESSSSFWEKHSATALISQSPFDDILVDVGLSDTFYAQGQLLPEDLKTAAEAAGKPLTLRMHADYGHDFYFYSTFISEHIKFHADKLKNL